MDHSNAGRTLILWEHDLAGLACAAIAVRSAEAGERPAVLLPTSISDHARAAARRGIERLGLTSIDLNAGQGNGGAAQTRLLLVAAQTAAQNGCVSLVWATQRGGSDPGQALRTIAATLDRALLRRWPDGLPLPPVDLSDEQLAELCLDLAVPLETCSWWGRSDKPAARWEAALRGAGWRPDAALV